MFEAHADWSRDLELAWKAADAFNFDELYTKNYRAPVRPEDDQNEPGTNESDHLRDSINASAGSSLGCFGAGGGTAMLRYSNASAQGESRVLRYSNASAQEEVLLTRRRSFSFSPLPFFHSVRPYTAEQKKGKRKRISSSPLVSLHRIIMCRCSRLSSTGLDCEVVL